MCLVALGDEPSIEVIGQEGGLTALQTESQKRVRQLGKAEALHSAPWSAVGVEAALGPVPLWEALHGDCPLLCWFPFLGYGL